MSFVWLWFLVGGGLGLGLGIIIGILLLHFSIDRGLVILHGTRVHPAVTECCGPMLDMAYPSDARYYCVIAMTYTLGPCVHLRNAILVQPKA